MSADGDKQARIIKLIGAKDFERCQKILKKIKRDKKWDDVSEDGGKFIGNWVHNATHKHVHRPANYMCLKKKHGKKLEKLRKIDKEIAFGYLLLKVIYVGKDARQKKTGKMRRAKRHYSAKPPTSFERYVQRFKGRKYFAWIYAIPPEHAALYAVLESLLISTIGFFDREKLMNDHAGETLRDIIQANLRLDKRFEMLAYLMDCFHAADIYY